MIVRAIVLLLIPVPIHRYRRVQLNAICACRVNPGNPLARAISGWQVVMAPASIEPAQDDYVTNVTPVKS